MKILIMGANYNRRKIARICWKQLNETKNKKDEVIIWDDKTTEYDVKKEFKNIVFDYNLCLFSENIGIHQLRGLQIDAHSKLDNFFDGIYFTDSDAYHDPEWRKELDRLHKINPNAILCLYNTLHHAKLKDCGAHFEQQYCPGISMFLPIKMINQLSDNPKILEMKSWDYDVSNMLGKPPVLCSKTSYVEHFGANSIHNSDFERDRAQNPTKYLRKRRDVIIRRITTLHNPDYIVA